MQKKKVHITFKAHSEGEPYQTDPLPPDVKAFVMEHSEGRMAGHPWKVPATPLNIHDDTVFKFMRKVLDSGIRLEAGETFIDRGQERRMKKLVKDTNLAFKAAVDNPTFEHIRDYYAQNAEYTRFRHDLIKRTIGALSSEGRIEGEFGTQHSLLHKELLDEGIEVSRTISSILFGWDPIVCRKLQYGMGPDDVPAIEYKKAFAELTMPYPWFDSMMCGKPGELLTDSDVRFLSIVQNAMFDRMSEGRLDDMLRREDYAAVFLDNGLANPFVSPSKKSDFAGLLDRNARERPKSLAGFLWRRMKASGEAEKHLAGS